MDRCWARGNHFLHGSETEHMKNTPEQGLRPGVAGQHKTQCMISYVFYFVMVWGFFLSLGFIVCFIFLFSFLRT